MKRTWVFIGWICLAMTAMAADTEYTLPEQELIEQARRILREAPLIDGHNDTPWQYRKRLNNRLSGMDLAADLSQLEPPMQTDIARLRQGGVGAQFWSVYVPATFRGPDGVYMVVEQIDMTKRIVDRYADTFELAFSADDIVRIHKAGKIGSLIGMEGGHSMGNSLAALRQLYALGARYMTLTHSLNIDWADSGTDEPFVGGLSDFGEEVVREMNRLGMMVDLSHVHPETMHDAIDVSAAPVIFSHSSAYAVTPHPRNVPDDVLERLPKSDGVVMVTFLSNYVNEGFMPYVDEYRVELDRLRSQYPDDEALVEEAMDAWKTAHPAP
ncbi:MAG: dipeptidase, partial [Candidatus Hydrogenedentales bacterium]